MYRGEIVAIIDARTADKRGGRAADGDRRRRVLAADATKSMTDRPGAGVATRRRRPSGRPRPRTGRRRFVQLAIIAARSPSLAAHRRRASIIIVSSSLDRDARPAAAVRGLRGLLEGAFGSVRRHLDHARRRRAADPRRAGGRPRLQGRPVQHRRAGPVPHGRLAAAAVGASVAEPPAIVAIPLAVARRRLAGRRWGFIPGALKAWTGAHEVVTTIMLNFIACDLRRLPRHRTARGARASRSPGPATIGNAALPIALRAEICTSGVLIAFALVPVVWWLLWRTHARLRDPDRRRQPATPRATPACGPRCSSILTMSLCGLLAGLAGAIQILGVSGFMTASYRHGDRLRLRSRSRCSGAAHPVGIMFAALLFGAMRAGAPA